VPLLCHPTAGHPRRLPMLSWPQVRRRRIAQLGEGTLLMGGCALFPLSLGASSAAAVPRAAVCLVQAMGTEGGDLYPQGQAACTMALVQGFPALPVSVLALPIPRRPEDAHFLLQWRILHQHPLHLHGMR